MGSTQLPTAGLRDSAQAIAPPFLSEDCPASANNPTGGVAGRLVYLLGLMGDALVDRTQQGMYARLPLGGTSAPSGGNGGPYQDAVGLIGADRGLVQGMGESPLAFGKRCQRAFPTWQHSGQAPTVMQEVLAYLQTQCRIAVVADSNNLGEAYATEYAAGANTALPPAHWLMAWVWDTGYGQNYAAGIDNAWDGHPASTWGAWWRDWLVLWSVAPYAWASAAPTWGSGVRWGQTSFSWGLSVPASTIASIRALVKTWKCANTWYRWIVVSLDANFANWTAGAAYYPTSGNWQKWSKVVNGQYVVARSVNLRYCDGVF